jgi:hypothetical protein
MGIVFQDLMKAAAIDNKLVGSTKQANEELTEDFNSVDKRDVKLMSNAGGAAAGTVDDKAERTGATSPDGAGAGTRAKLPTPAAVSPETAQQFENLQKRPLKTSRPAPADAQAPATGDAQPQ